MSYLVDKFDDLCIDMPGVPNLMFSSNRDMQDFTERDFDRRLELLKVEALIFIAERLKDVNGIDTGAGVN